MNCHHLLIIILLVVFIVMLLVAVTRQAYKIDYYERKLKNKKHVFVSDEWRHIEDLMNDW